MKYETIYTYKNGYAIIATKPVAEKPDKLTLERRLAEAQNRKVLVRKQRPLLVQGLSG